jgi:hypothetical protein
MTDGKTPPDSGDLSELNKARLDLAWKHFEHAINQRLTMFNFYIVFMGALFVAFANTLKSDQVGIIQGVIGGFGIVAGIIFGFLDQRNQYLYRIAEYNIYLLERTFLYDDKSQQPVPLINPKGRDTPESCFKGIITTQWEGSCNLRRIEEYSRAGHYNVSWTYGFLMPLFYFLTVIAFSAIAVSSYMGFLRG